MAWVPPPPEYADVTEGSGLEAYVHKWDPSLGAPASLLDVLPAGSPALGDFNRDGYADVFVPIPGYTNATLAALRAPSSRLFMNDGSTDDTGATGQRFLDVTDVSGVDVRGFAYAASWGDLDKDGWPDLFVGGYRMARLFRNTGISTFTDVTASAGLPQDGIVLGGAWGDYDRDGDLDLALARFANYTHPDDGLPDLHALAGMSNVLLRNNGDGTFADVSAAAGFASVARRSTSAAWVDVDRDGFLDLYVTNYGEAAEYWRNNQDGTFTERAALAGIGDGRDATCQAWEDVDRDGLLDLYVAHEAGARDGLWRARLDGTFEDRSALLAGSEPGRAWGCFAYDQESDGDIDLFAAHAELQGAMRQAPRLLNNSLDRTGLLGFEDATAEAGDNDVCPFEPFGKLGAARALGGAVPYDFNLRGAPGVLAVGIDGDTTHLFRNVAGKCGWGGGAGNFLKLWLRGKTSNALGLGATVTVSAGTVSVTRQLGSSASWGGGQGYTEATFGLNKGENAGYSDAGKDVSVTVRWPGGLVESYPSSFRPSTSALLIEGVGFQADTLAPRPALALVEGTPGLNGWYTSETVKLKLVASDPSGGGSQPCGVQSLRYSLDGVAWTTVANPSKGVTLTFTGDGTHELWVETQDKSVSPLLNPDCFKPEGPNRAVFLYPIRIDTKPPVGELAEPAPGSVWLQGREVARARELGAANRALVLAPAPLRLGEVPEAGPPLDAAVGSEGLQPVEALARDATSGVWKVQYAVTRTDGRVVAQSPELKVAPYAWAWRANATAALEYRIVTTVTDYAGHVAELVNKVELVPTTADGLQATQRDGLSNPAPP